MDLKQRVSQADIDLVKASGLFDAAWYLERYKDVSLLGVDPVEHYLWIGHRMGRSPSPGFCAPSYRNANRDIRSSGMDPLLHYLRAGQSERRPTYPVIDDGTQHLRQKCGRIFRRRNREWDWAAHDAMTGELEALPHDHAGTKVSIVMPTYNRGALLPAAIASVLAQTHANFELIVVDDHSSDNTAEILRDIDDPRLVRAVNGYQKGVSGARNTGLDLAGGDWIFFLDSDNSWHPRMIEFMLKHATRAETSAGYCAADIQDDAGQSKFILYAEFDYESCLQENFIDLNCFFLRWSGPFRDLRFDENLRRLVDWDFILNVATRTRVVGLPYVGVTYDDGSAERITNKEHVSRESLQDLLEQVRAKARPATLEAETILDSSAYRVAVQLHVFHPDRVPECLEYLRNIRFDFDLFVTTSLDEDHAALALIREVYPHARVLRYANAGADIGPFLELISTFKSYQLLLKIHTKRDVEPWGDAWRRGLLEPLLGSADLVDEIVERFRADAHLAMACSGDFYKHGIRNSIPASLDQLTLLAGETGLSDHLESDWAFVAGTMFWVRPQIYLQLARHMCDSEGYSVQFLRDGAIEHGLERALGLALWQDPDNRVALVSMQGEISETALGEACSLEGVSQTMKRLHGA
ncbi:hypothetical protein CEW88_23655 (plasmid) [Alloyangia pacifica]|uniref:Glycosyltransferase 2-like domain-containing protein n=1 Tax=Alloyangia pacifica TaxID=311180 RepID=A0A2U8HM01_9RHOB|nr:glycosyltransferase [Alloyangia pacifica]AWI86761.1 hypothetical protein CEW88_23655 [Alloyangia pacifica]